MTGDVEPVEDLFRRARAGEVAATDALVRRIEPALRAAIERRLGGRLRRRMDTDDIVQATLAAALPVLANVQYRGESALQGWFVFQAERQIRNAARRLGAAKRDLGREQPLPTDAAIALSATSPSQGAVRSEARTSVQVAIAGLPDDERRAVELRSYRGLSFQAMARELGLPNRAAAYKLYEKALLRMGEVLDGPESGEERAREGGRGNP